jgi:hypothetical protein
MGDEVVEQCQKCGESLTGDHDCGAKPAPETMEQRSHIETVIASYRPFAGEWSPANNKPLLDDEMLFWFSHSIQPFGTQSRRLIEEVLRLRAELRAALIARDKDNHAKP